MRLPLGMCCNVLAQIIGMLRAERTILDVDGLVIVIWFLWWRIVHYEWVCSFILCTWDLLNHPNIGIFSIIFIILHCHYFSIRVISSSFIIYIYASLLIHFRLALLNHPLVMFLASLVATTTSAYSLYLQARLLILRQVTLIANGLAFLTHVLEVGLLALRIDLVIKIADVVDNACGALICGIDLDYTILSLSSSSEICCSS